ncbi:MAG: oxidoreductase [Bacteroidetes bacterium HGW-Bacteroidetes-21]|jgi:UDP-N-acetyl-2-amino-2-deoxyglucuronate dehydrogenase|nr:MAG: oxidoreductase [Bacteroidetes bacterium HGW-Bacteroidetes-21]
MKKFALIGAAGYIAPRHVKAIKDTGNTLTAFLDPFDSVGFIDSYFPQADYFREFERFDRHVDKLRHSGNKLDYISICSPNYFHDSHIRFALRNDCTAICEKPIVLNPWNIDALVQQEKESGQKVYNILQLRHHPVIIGLKEEVEKAGDKIYDIDLAYITSRGSWYHYSWKGDVQKSGGIATNIGIHFFDMLSWIFGDVKSIKVHVSDNNKASGYMELEKARIRWFLSIDENDLPQKIKEKGQRTYRSINIAGKELEFSEGFTDLHTVSYQNILAGTGYGLKDCRPSVDIAWRIRNEKPLGLTGDYHPLLTK